MAGPNLTAYIRLDGIDKANQQLKQLEAQGEKAAKAIGMGGNGAQMLTAVATGYTAISLAVTQLGNALRPVVKFMQDSVKESAEAQRQNMMLANSVKGNITALLEYNATMQKRYSIDADAIAQGQAVAAVMTNLGAEAMPLVTQAAIQLNAITGGDLVSSFETVARSVNGGNKVLKQFGIDAKDAKTQGERLNLIIEATAGGMDIARSKATDYKGSMDQLSLSVGDFKEAIGDTITKSDTFNGSLRVMADYLDAVRSSFADATTAGDFFGGIIAGATLLVAELGAKLEGVGGLVAALMSGNPATIAAGISVYAGKQIYKQSGLPTASPGDVGPLAPGTRYRTQAEEIAYQTEQSVLNNIAFRGAGRPPGSGGAGGGRTLPGGAGGRKQARPGGSLSPFDFQIFSPPNWNQTRQDYDDWLWLNGLGMPSGGVTAAMGLGLGARTQSPLGSQPGWLGYYQALSGPDRPFNENFQYIDQLPKTSWRTNVGNAFQNPEAITALAGSLLNGGGAQGLLGTAGSIAGNAIFPGIGGILGGWLGGGLGKLFGGGKKKQRDGQTNATAFIFQSPQLEDIRVAILRLAPSLRASGGGINSTVRNIALQAAR